MPNFRKCLFSSSLWNLKNNMFDDIRWLKLLIIISHTNLSSFSLIWNTYFDKLFKKFQNMEGSEANQCKSTSSKKQVMWCKSFFVVELRVGKQFKMV